MRFQSSAPCKAVGHYLSWWQPLVTKCSAEVGQDISVAVVAFVCTDVPMPGMFLHRFLQQAGVSLSDFSR